jgi:FkbM family methyltransferase
MSESRARRWRHAALTTLRDHGVDIQRAASWHDRAGGRRHVPTLIDVGFAFGSPDLYAMFSADRLVCVDALEEYAVHADRFRPQFGRVDFVATALGSLPGTQTINVSVTEPTKSSFGTRLGPQAGRVVEPRDVPSTTLDLLAADLGLDGPMAIKIDTEGWELEVLRGATECLARSSQVVLEASVAPRFENGYDLTDLVVYLADAGFHVTTVLSARPRRDATIPFLDLLFERAS